MIATESLNSIGYLAGTLQRMPARIKAAAESIGVQPLLTLNGIPHYSDTQAEQIAAALAARVPAKQKH